MCSSISSCFFNKCWNWAQTLASFYPSLSGNSHHTFPLLNLFFPCPVNSNGDFGLWDGWWQPCFYFSYQGKGAKELDEGEPRMGAGQNSHLTSLWVHEESVCETLPVGGELFVFECELHSSQKDHGWCIVYEHAYTQHRCSCTCWKTLYMSGQGSTSTPTAPFHMSAYTLMAGEKCSAHLIVHPRLREAIQEKEKENYDAKEKWNLKSCSVSIN